MFWPVFRVIAESWTSALISHFVELLISIHFQVSTMTSFLYPVKQNPPYIRKLPSCFFLFFFTKGTESSEWDTVLGFFWNTNWINVFRNFCFSFLWPCPFFHKYAFSSTVNDFWENWNGISHNSLSAITFFLTIFQKVGSVLLTNLPIWVVDLGTFNRAAKASWLHLQLMLSLFCFHFRWNAVSW